MRHTIGGRGKAVIHAAAPWAACVLFAALAGGLSGCATSPSASSVPATDIITASDESEARKRARIRLELAVNYFAEGRTEIALDEIKQALAVDPQYAAAHNLRGLVQMRLGDLRAAEDSFRRALALDPSRLQALDERLSAWMGLARRLRRQPEELPALLQQWEQELQQLDQAIDLDALQQRCEAALADYERAASAATKARRKAAPRLSQQVTQAMQQLGMAGGRFEVALLPETEPQSWGRESAELRVAGHEGSEIGRAHV